MVTLVSLRARVFEWHKQYVEGKEEDPKTERPSTFKTNANIEKVCQLVYSDQQITICIMTDKLGIAKETVRISLIEKLGVQKMCAKMVTRFLTPKQKACCLKACQDIPPQLEANDKILKEVITGGKSWILEDDPKTKQQNHQWKTVGSSRPKTRLLCHHQKSRSCS